MIRVADTSYLYALFNAADRYHAGAVGFAETEVATLIPTEVFAETFGLIHARAGFQAAESARDWLLARRHFRVAFTDAAIHEGAWQRFRASKGRLTFVDWVAVEWARLENAQLVTFDRAQAKAAKS